MTGEERAGGASEATREAGPEAPFTWRHWAAAVAVTLAVLAFTAVAVRRVELVTGRYVTTGAPPVPAVGALLLLLGWQTLARRAPSGLRRWLLLDRRQILLIYVMVCLGVALNSQYLVRAFLPHLVALQYWQSHNHSAFARWVPYLPAWYAPTNKEVIRQYWESTRGGPIPWGAWVAPLGRWCLFFAAAYGMCWGLVVLLRRQWLHAERLSFPLLQLPLALTADAAPGSRSTPLFRDPLLWAGVGLAAAWNGINIAHAFWPTVPAPGFSYSFAGTFTDRIWLPFNTVSFFFMLEAVGFGYFIPLEVSFSVWFFYLFLKLFAVAGLSLGYEGPGFPYLQDQSAGAYLGMAAFLLWGARRHLASVVRSAFHRRGAKNTPEGREELVALGCLAVGAAGLLAWFWISGFSLFLSLPFLAVLLCFALVYTRIRAETGVPFVFLYPYGFPKEMIVNALSSRGVLDLAGSRGWVLFSCFAWLSRHHYLEETSAYTADGLKLAEEGRIPRRWLYAGLVVAVAAGLMFAFWSNLGGFYDVGANLAGGGKVEYRASVAVTEFQQMADRAAVWTPRSNPRLAAEAGGLLVAVGLAALRTVWVKSPFHPLGYVLATCYGDTSTLIFPMFLAWGCKAMVLKAGGLPLYRRGAPLFLGLIAGHYLIAGVIWPALALLLAPEASQSYHLFFGG